MKPVDTSMIEKTKHLENVVFVCFGTPRGEELPQVATEEEIIVDLIHKSTGDTHEHIDAGLHGQDPE